MQPINRKLPDDEELRAFLCLLLEVLHGQRAANQLAPRLASRVVAAIPAQREKAPSTPRRLRSYEWHLKDHNEAMEIWGTLSRYDTDGPRVEAFTSEINCHRLSWQCTQFRVLSSAA